MSAFNIRQRGAYFITEDSNDNFWLNGVELATKGDASLTTTAQTTQYMETLLFTSRCNHLFPGIHFLSDTVLGHSV